MYIYIYICFLFGFFACSVVMCPKFVNASHIFMTWIELADVEGMIDSDQYVRLSILGSEKFFDGFW